MKLSKRHDAVLTLASPERFNTATSSAEEEQHGGLLYIRTLASGLHIVLSMVRAQCTARAQHIPLVTIITYQKAVVLAGQSARSPIV